MVKKHKGGRRQILQLEDKKHPSRNEFESSPVAASNNNSCPLDTQVADFFKEIDALAVNNHIETENSEAACTPSDIASCSKQKDSEESNSLDGLPEKTEDSQAVGSKKDSGNYCPWQEICDESTGYNYYWNVETNDVTWECPTEYLIYLKNMHSTGGEDLSQLNQSNSNENHKKTKKKKDAPKPPEGAIIPISYFGGSSSEESSDEEKENGFLASSKCSNLKAEPNVPISTKKTCKKNDSHYSKNKKEPSVEMGPHLPDENHLTKTISSATRTNISSEIEVASKNEVDEYLEIGPQLASNSEMNLSKNIIDLNTDCNTVSDSSSKCTNVPQSIKNGQSDASSSTVDDSWELSLKIIEREFKGLEQDIGEDSPDSTVKKGENFLENNVSCQTSNETFGLRGVVEYDNFTDEEEEMSSSNISSSKSESVTVHKVQSSECKLSRDEEVFYQEQKKCDSKTEVSQSESQRNLFKRKFSAKTDESESLSFKKSKPKTNNIDFDKMFSNHGNSGKYGFGFSRQEQLNLESELFCSTSSHNQSNYAKSSNDYKAINFVKSDHVFDLSTLTKNITSDNASHSKSNESKQSSDNKNESIYAPGPSGLNIVTQIQESKETISSETISSEIVHIEDNNSNTKITDALSFKNDTLTKSSNNEPGSSYEKDRTKDISSSKVNNSFRVDEDIDEIDRQLSEALEAKIAENAAVKPSSSSPILSPRIKKTDTDSSVPKKASIENAKFTSNAASSKSLSDVIVDLSSLLIDKLTFLISNHSTLTSLSSLLIQIQTRLIDWQASALDSRYFLSRLQEVEQYLHHYEIGAVSGDWSCQWDRENKRYFYMNSRTQQSQWSYPEELCDKENSLMPSSTDLASTSTASPERSLERDELQTVSSSVPEGQLNNRSTFCKESNKDTSDKYSDLTSMWISESSPPPPPPGVDSPPPPPPQSPPPDSPPPPPPDSTEVEDLLEDMDIENSDDSSPPIIVTNSGVDTPADTVMPYPKFAIPSPERSSENFPSASIANAVSSTSLSSFEDMNTVSKSPQLVSTSRDTFDTTDNMHWSALQPSCSTDIASNFDSESEANILPDPKLLSSDKDCDANASSSSSRNCEGNASSTSSRNCDVNASSSSNINYDVNASSSSNINYDVNASSSSNRNYDVNASSSSNRNYDVNASSSSNRNYDVNASSSSNRNYDVNASSSSNRNYDINESSSSNRNCDVNASSSSYRNCDVNTSSSNYINCDVNASSSNYINCDVNASCSSSSRSYICSNEVTTYRKNCGPYPSTSTSVSASTTSSKKEKKKAKLSSGLALKKKNIPSLVEKWQKIKEEQDKEDKDSEDPRI